MDQRDSSKCRQLRRALARRLAKGTTAFEAALLIKPPALRGVSDSPPWLKNVGAPPNVEFTGSASDPVERRVMPCLPNSRRRNLFCDRFSQKYCANPNARNNRQYQADQAQNHRCQFENKACAFD